MVNIISTEFVNYLDLMISSTSNFKNSHCNLYYQWLLSTFKEIKITNLSKIQQLKYLTQDKLKFVTLKQCFFNSIKILELNPKIKYVEGFLNFNGIIFEHSWNKIGNYYFDITKEKFFNEEEEYENYFSVIELSKKQVYDLIVKTGTYGSLMSFYFQEAKR